MKLRYSTTSHSIEVIKVNDFKWISVAIEPIELKNSIVLI